ncbi:hypothetical protein H0W26_00260 [Candidatus Dependentiae bacterium]|nr:hypothetical protein [Candidatus Dependentiae bacterium]
MCEKRNVVLLISMHLFVHFPMVSPLWACDGAFLKREVQECYAKISRGEPVGQKQIIDGLNFLYNEKDFVEFKYEDFIKAIESFSFISATDNECYHSFARICYEIYENGNERQKVAISILFKEVSNEYLSYYIYKKHLAESKKRKDDFYKSKKYDYHSLFYIMQLVYLIEYFPSDIKLFIDSTLMCLVEREYPSVKGELLRYLLINGDPMDTSRMEKISDKAFYLITGIKRITFEKMVSILQEVFDLKMLRTGIKNKLSAENILLMAIEFFGGYGTRNALGKSYDLDPISAYRNIKSVEAIFAKALKLNLPLIFDKKKSIADELINNSIEGCKKSV